MADRTLRWSPEGQEDFNEILKFYRERNGNSDYGNKLAVQIKAALDNVVLFPYLGQKRGRSGFRYVIVYPFQVFYYVTKTEIVVSAVWDSRRDPKALKKYLRRLDS